ncbi:MAG: hypothetical protein H0W83_16785, partial [Planctomycetes bacterium]|nr:hypothetical protein [Planctomycetota bacterium]
MRLIAVPLLLLAAAALSATDAIMLADFEADDSKVFETPPMGTIVAEHAKHGTHALRIVTAADAYPGIAFQGGKELARFHERPLFCMDIFNPSDQSVTFTVRADDAKSKDYGSRANDDGYSARPGWSTLRVNLTG